MNWNKYKFILFFRLAQVQQNRKRLVPIIEWVLLCGKKEIPLRDHREFGKILIDGNLKYII